LADIGYYKRSTLTPVIMPPPP